MKEVTLSVENESETEEGVDEPVRYPVTDIYGFCNSSRKKKQWKPSQPVIITYKLRCIYFTSF